MRGHEKSLAGRGSEWPGVIIVDMPVMPEMFWPESEDSNTLVISRRDWEALHSMLLSTSAVISYVERVLGSNTHVTLDNESERYFRFADADSGAPGSKTSLPMLPGEPLRDRDLIHALVVDERIEVIGGQAPGEGPWSDPDDQRLAIEVLDALPPLHRVEFGAKLIDVASKSLESGLRKSGMMRVEPGVGSIVFLTDQATNYDDAESDVAAWLAALTAVRHDELALHFAVPGPTLGIARVQAEDGSVLQSSVLVTGHRSTVPSEIRWAILCEHGMFDRERGRMVSPTSVGRNEPCPCGSGEKFKRCHLDVANRAR